MKAMKALRTRKVGLVSFGFWLLAFSLTACFPEKSEQVTQVTNDNVEIIQTHLDDHQFFVPKAYLHRRGKILDTSILLSAMFPEFVPIQDDPQNLWKQGEWHKNVDVQIRNVPKPAGAKESAKITVNSLKALEISSVEYGLIHQTQPKDVTSDLWDVWLEKGQDGEVFSYTTCTEKLTQESVPQCSHHMYWNKFHVQTDFDKRLLPEWKKIKDNTLALLESFRSEETARVFLGERLEQKPIAGGGG